MLTSPVKKETTTPLPAHSYIDMAWRGITAHAGCRRSCPVNGDVSFLLRGFEDAGIIGSGTNNARLAGMLRGLSSYYYKEPTLLFLVRVAQGLVHMGKGLLNLTPKHVNGNLVSGAAAFRYQKGSFRLLCSAALCLHPGWTGRPSPSCIVPVSSWSILG